MSDYPIHIFDSTGAPIDRAANVGSAESVLYGFLAQHDGNARTIYAPPGDVARLKHLAAINADCWGIPLDVVKPASAQVLS